MTIHRQAEPQKPVTKKHHGKSNASDRKKTPAAGHIDEAWQRFFKHFETGRYDQALQALSALGRSLRVDNARGVCLMRLGRIEEATRTMRGVVLNPGCTWMRPDVPAIYKANFATALLLGGHASGCWEILAEINDEAHPSVARLRSAIKQWSKTLSLWQRFNWRVCRIDPSKPVPLDFPPGELDFELTPPPADTPTPPSPPLKTAA